MVSSWVEGKRSSGASSLSKQRRQRAAEIVGREEKNAIIRGAAGRKSPLGGRAKVGDRVYFVETGGDLLVTHPWL